MNERVGVLRLNGEFSLIAAATAEPGEVLFRLEGQTTVKATRYSVQIGEACHIDLSDDLGPDAILDTYYWRFMNHHCEPTVAIRGRDVYAIRRIEKWQEITFNYNTTEFDMAEPFVCRCGSVNCRGEIRGWHWLSAEEKERLAPLAAPYLLIQDQQEHYGFDSDANS